MKKLLLSGIVGLSLCCSSAYSNKTSITEKEPYSAEITEQEIIERTVNEVIDEAIEDTERNGVTTKNSLSTLTRILYEIPEEKESKNIYKEMNILEGFSHSLREKYERDPLFYDWRSHEFIDSKTGEISSFVWRGYFTKAAWDVAVGKYKILQDLEKVSTEIKKKTTWSPSFKKTKISISPDVNLEGRLGAKFKIKSPNKYLNLGRMRINNEEIKLGAKFDFLKKRFGRKSRIIVDLNYDIEGDEELIFKVTWKVPQIGWQPKKEEKENNSSIDWKKKW